MSLDNSFSKELGVKIQPDPLVDGWAFFPPSISKSFYVMKTHFLMIPEACFLL